MPYKKKRKTNLEKNHLDANKLKHSISLKNSYLKVYLLYVILTNKAEDGKLMKFCREVVQILINNIK